MIKPPSSTTGLYRFVAACFVALLTAATAQADETDDAFEAKVRAYLLAHPEVILDALDVLSQRELQSAQKAKIDAYPFLFAEPASLGLGPNDAPIRVVEFFDYRCAPCKALHPKLKAALSAHPQLRVEMLQLPILSPGSERAARFALAVKSVAGAQSYAAVHGHLWDLRGALNVEAFKRICDIENLDWPSIKAAMASDFVSERIGRNRDIAIDLEILGTPAFVTPASVSFGDSDAEALVQGWLSQ